MKIKCNIMTFLVKYQDNFKCVRHFWKFSNAIQTAWYGYVRVTTRSYFQGVVRTKAERGCRGWGYRGSWWRFVQADVTQNIWIIMAGRIYPAQRHHQWYSHQRPNDVLRDYDTARFALISVIYNDIAENA